MTQESCDESAQRIDSGGDAHETTAASLGFEQFAPTDSAINLAVFRVAVFCTLLCSKDLRDSLWYSSLPAQLLTPPTELKQFLQIIPISPTVDGVAIAIMVVACCGAIIGLRARLCAFVASISAIYVLGVPQMYGKVMHPDAPLIWFALLLSSSRCADVLSLDAVLAARKDATRVRSEPPVSPAYGVPIRIIWLVFATIYFWPGYWKLHTAGFEWAQAESLKMTLWNQWSSAQASQPLPLRLDEFPALLQMAATGTLIFELGFVIAILFPVTRALLPGLGTLFHTFIYLTMRINLLSLIPCYVIFWDWSRVWKWLKDKLRVDANKLSVNENDAFITTTDSHATTLNRPSLPVLPAVTGLCLLLILNAYGAMGKTQAWPFSCMPLFNGIPKSLRVTALSPEIFDSKGNKLQLANERLRFDDARWLSVWTHALGRNVDRNQRQERMLALWHLYKREDEQAKSAARVRFYLDLNSVDPALRANNPISRATIAEFRGDQ